MALHATLRVPATVVQVWAAGTGGAPSANDIASSAHTDTAVGSGGLASGPGPRDGRRPADTGRPCKKNDERNNDE